MKFRGGGATRKTGSCCPKPLKKTCLNSFDEKIECHPELDSGSITDNRLRLGGRSDKSSRMPRTPFGHSDRSQSLSMPVNSICHSELAAKSVETGSKRDFMPLPGDSESINADRNNLRRIDRTDQSSRNAAFTLAEVLITE